MASGAGRLAATLALPPAVEVRDADRTLRLNLDEPAHIEILRIHLQRHAHAVLTEAVIDAAELGWLDGHVHEIALPLISTRAPAPNPLPAPLVEITNHGHGQLPGSPDASWFYAKLHTHPDRLDELIAEQLPRLLAQLDTASQDSVCWFVRYRGSRETDHLRLRIHTPSPERYAVCAAAVGDWTQRLRRGGWAGQLSFDTYFPETGRYAPGTDGADTAMAMRAAELVFAADSRVVLAQLHHGLGIAAHPDTMHPDTMHPVALAALNTADLARGFFGNPTEAMTWLATRPAPMAGPGLTAGREVTDQAVRAGLLRTPSGLPNWPDDLAQAWRARAGALATYRRRLPGLTQAGTDTVLESLLHMHHNRAIGIDPDSETTCRRLARQIALSWTAHHNKGTR